MKFLSPATWAVIDRPYRKRRLSAALALFGLLCGATLLAAPQITVTGVIRAEEEVIVRSEYSGIVQKIAVREGDRVVEGQLLVELKNERQKIVVDAARAGLAKTRASVDETKVLLDNAEKEFERVKTAGNALPRKEYDDKSDAVLRLKANLLVLMAEVTQAGEEVRLRENELKETQLRAPFNGAVTQIHVIRGDSIRPLDTPVLELVALDQLYAEMLLPSSYIQRVSPNQKVPLHIESEWMGRAGQIEGTVIYINPKVDAASRTFRVKIGVPNASGLVRPGMLTEAQFD